MLAEEYAGDLHESGILLFAFKVCPLGFIGPMGIGMLFGTPHPGRPKGAWKLKPNAARVVAAATGEHAPSDVLGRANCTWAQANKTGAFFGQTYHLATPRAWAEQVLGFNVVHALALHLQCRIQRSEAHLQGSMKRGYTPGQGLRSIGSGTAMQERLFDSLMPDCSTDDNFRIILNALWDPHFAHLGAPVASARHN